MSRKILLLGTALLLLAGGGALLRTRRTLQENHRAPIQRVFPAAEDARRHAVARLWGAQGTHPAGDPYSATFTRRFSPLVGEPLDYYLVDEPARELELAEGYLEHGFAREALAHFDALITFHSESPEALRAKSRLEACRKATVLGLVPPLSVIIEDSAGMRYVSAAVERAEPPTLERIQDPWLGRPVRVEGPVTAVGFVDDAGAVVPGEIAPPSVFMADVREGAVFSARPYYRLRRAGSLFDLEAIVKKEYLKGLAERTDTSVPENLPAFRRIAEALLYIGCREEATMLLALIEEVPSENPPDAPSSPLHLDALWESAVADHPRFTLETKSSVTTGAEIPIELDVQAIDRLTFSFARLEGPLPVQEKDVKGWFEKAGAKPSHEVTLPVAPGKSTLLLPVREAGSFRVTARARGLSAAFLVVRTDLAVDLLAFPGETLFSAGRPGISISDSRRILGATEPDGLLSFQGGVLGKFCDEHRQCCASCESCLHHHTDEAVLNSGSPVFVSGRGQFFRAKATIETRDVSKHRPPPPAPILLVYTDRPVYKAGDTMRFRGILRVPRQPLKRGDAVRLDPAPERDVALSIRCGDASLFQRTYVTGDHGTFSGEFTLPLTASRSEYAIEIAYADAKITRSFQVMDYRKSDYAITLTPEDRGIRIDGGYVWGAPVTGAVLRCTVGGKDVAPENGVVPMRDGERLLVDLVRDGQTLATKSMSFRARPAAPPASAQVPEASPAPSAPAAVSPEKKEEATSFVLKPGKTLYRRGETIEVELTGPWDQAEAMVVVGDSQLYDLARVPIRAGRGTARFPARSIHDPGVAIFAICNGLQARADVLVRTNEMAVSIEAPSKARPGERVEVTLRADPKAALSLSAVDEAIYMIAEDETPEIYTHFYTPRPAAIAWGRCEDFEFDGDTLKIEKPIEGPHFRRGDLVIARLARHAGIYDTLGVGAGGGRYGGRFGQRMDLVARGAGTRATESACLACLKALGGSQNADGSWTSSCVTPAGTISNTGTTSLALLSFLGAGYSHLSRDEYPDPANPGQTLKFGEIVKKGLQWLVSQQAPDGRLAPASSDLLLNHAFAALALSEAYGMTASAPLKDPAQKAIDFLVSRQASDGGWPTSDPRGGSEILPSTVAVMALWSASLSELRFAPLDRTWQYFNQIVNDDGLCGNPPTRVTVAGAMLAQLILRKDRTEPRVIAAADWLAARKPQWAQQDFLGWYLTSLALYQFDGPEGAIWKSWNDPIKNTLVPNQAKAGWWTVGNESIVPTALGALTMEIYYRYANVFGGSGGSKAQPLMPAPRVRLYFPDTAFWAPDLVTDENGEARVSFTLPDQISTTRLTARGITKDSAAGQAVARIAALQPFFVKICAPEFAVQGDEIEIRVEAYNYTKSAVDAILRLEGAGDSQTVRVTTDRPASASWRVRAGDPAGLRLVARGAAGGREDVMERVIPVRREGREEIVTARRNGETGQALKFDAAPGAEDLVVKIHPERGTLSQLLDALRYLNAYPYG